MKIRLLVDISFFFFDEGLNGRFRS